jgi:hypothetical protein
MAGWLIGCLYQVGIVVYSPADNALKASAPVTLDDG